MPSVSISCGRILILIGALGYIYSYMSGRTSWTALIPAFFGLLFMVLGYVARAKEDLRKHLMHAAMVFALLGFLASAGRLISKFGEISFSAVYVSQILMALTCLFLVVFGVKSFIDARKN